MSHFLWTKDRDVQNNTFRKTRRWAVTLTKAKACLSIFSLIARHFVLHEYVSFCIWRAWFFKRHLFNLMSMLSWGSERIELGVPSWMCDALIISHTVLTVWVPEFPAALLWVQPLPPHELTHDLNQVRKLHEFTCKWYLWRSKHNAIINRPVDLPPKNLFLCKFSLCWCNITCNYRRLWQTSSNVKDTHVMFWCR